MSIRPVDPERATEVAREVYLDLERRQGRVGNMWKMLAHKPEALRTFNALYQAVSAPGALPPRLKELAYLRVSILNGCAY